MTPLVVSIAEAAQLLGISVWVARRWVADGLLPSLQLPSSKRPGERNRRVLIARADVEAFIEQHRTTA